MVFRRSGLNSLNGARLRAEYGSAYVGRLPKYKSLSANTGGVLPRARTCSTTRRQPGTRGWQCYDVLCWEPC